MLVRKLLVPVFLGGAFGYSVSAAPVVSAQSLCIVVDDPAPLAGESVEVRLELGPGDARIIGGQFTVRYDPEVLRFVEASPGSACDESSPFEFEIIEEVDETVGQVLYASAVALGGPGTQGPATMACLSFDAVGIDSTEVCLVDEPPATNTLVDEDGLPVVPLNDKDCPAVPPAISCEEITPQAQDSCTQVDADGDGDIDLVDYAAFQRCFNGPSR